MMPSRIRPPAALAATAIALLLALAAQSAIARSAVELHRLFEDRCGRCHGHAGDVVRGRIRLENGELRSTGTGRAIEPFLRRHHPPADPGEREALYAMLMRVAEGQGRFKNQCAVCHGRASELAVDKLIVTSDGLRGRYTGNDIAIFLLGHGRLDAEGAAFFHDLLLWQTAP